MAIIPEDVQEDYFWLFHDSHKGVYEFKDFLPKHKTKNDKIIPVFVLLGKDKDDRAGEFLLSTWNITNVKELKAQLGADSDLWKGKRFTLINIEDSKKMKLEVV